MSFSSMIRGVKIYSYKANLENRLTMSLHLSKQYITTTLYRIGNHYNTVKRLLEAMSVSYAKGLGFK